MWNMCFINFQIIQQCEEELTSAFRREFRLNSRRVSSPERGPGVLKLSSSNGTYLGRCKIPGAGRDSRPHIFRLMMTMAEASK